MVPTEDTKKFDEEETRSVRWITQNQAEDLIAETVNPTGRVRDLEHLKVAFELFRKSISIC